jgi:hypothetical protein
VSASRLHCSIALAAALGLALIAGCGRHGITNQPASLVSSSSIWLRNTYDTDPSIYVGRFLPPGVTEPDESNTMVLACSKHITARFIDGGGVDYSEDMHVNTQVALRLGLPVVASGSAGYEASRTAQARYKLTGKLVAEILDPDAFAACCKQQPDQCTDRFIGEFIQGAGSLHHSAGRNLDLAGQGTNPQTGISGEGGLSRSAEWQRAAEFPEPVYFAFKVSPTPYTQGAVSTCPSWVDSPPATADGFFVVGSADNHRSEGGARNAAMNHASNMAWRAAGVAVPVRQDEWCVTTTPKRNKTRYSARVLGFVSNETLAHAREQARIEAEREQARRDAAAEQARLDAEARRAIEAERTHTVAPDSPATPSDTDDWGDDEQPESPVAPTPTPAPASNPSSSSNAGASVLAAVQAEISSSARLSALGFSLRSVESLSASEGRAVLDEFISSSDRLEALKLMRGKIRDPNNWQVLVEAFSFSSDRDAARDLAPAG